MIIDAFQTITCILILIIAIPLFFIVQDLSVRIVTVILSVIGFVFSWDVGYFLYENSLRLLGALYTVAIMIASALGALIIAFLPIILIIIIILRIIFH